MSSDSPFGTKEPNQLIDLRAFKSRIKKEVIHSYEVRPPKPLIGISSKPSRRSALIPWPRPSRSELSTITTAELFANLLAAIIARFRGPHQLILGQLRRTYALSAPRMHLTRGPHQLELLNLDASALFEPRI